MRNTRTTKKTGLTTTESHDYLSSAMPQQFRPAQRRLSPSVDALGSVLIETTPDGILALVANKHTKAILEDQPVALIHCDSDFLPPRFGNGKGRK